MSKIQTLYNNKKRKTTTYHIDFCSKDFEFKDVEDVRIRTFFEFSDRGSNHRAPYIIYLNLFLTMLFNIIKDVGIKTECHQT